MAVSLLDVLVSGHPDRSPVHVPRPAAAGALCAAALLVVCVVDRFTRPSRGVPGSAA